MIATLLLEPHHTKTQAGDREMEIQDIKDKASELCKQGTVYGLTKEEKKDLALLLAIINKYDSKEKV